MKFIKKIKDFLRPKKDWNELTGDYQKDTIYSKTYYIPGYNPAQLPEGGNVIYNIKTGDMQVPTHKTLWGDQKNRRHGYAPGWITINLYHQSYYPEHLIAFDILMDDIIEICNKRKLTPYKIEFAEDGTTIELSILEPDQEKPERIETDIYQYWLDFLKKELKIKRDKYMETYDIPTRSSLYTVKRSKFLSRNMHTPIETTSTYPSLKFYINIKIP